MTETEKKHENIWDNIVSGWQMTKLYFVSYLHMVDHNAVKPEVFVQCLKFKIKKIKIKIEWVIYTE